MASEFYTIEEKAQKKIKALKSRKGEEYKSLRFVKAVAATAQRIIEKDFKKLNDNDYKDIALRIYKRNDIITISRIKNMMNTDIAKNMINSELVTYYNQANLTKERIPDLLKKVEEYADLKKDGNLILKLVEKTENVNNLTQKQSITARSSETIDYSKMGKDGNPLKKVTKTLEMTTNEAITSEMSVDKQASKNNDSLDSDVIDSTKEQNNV